MKEYTGSEFEIEFARAWLAYVEGGKVGVDPHDNWQVLRNDTQGWSTLICGTPQFNGHLKYRWKPQPKRTVNIGYMSGGTWLRNELVAPEVEEPAMGTHYFTLGLISAYGWTGDSVDKARLHSGLVFLTAEDRDAMSDWLATCRKGGQS